MTLRSTAVRRRRQTASAYVPIIRARSSEVGHELPARDFLIAAAAPRGQYALVPTPEDVAYAVEAWFDQQGFNLMTRGTPDGVAVDLVADANPDVVFREYGLGPTTVLAILAAEQRWLVEEDGRSGAAGGTYLDKARERLRLAIES